MPRLLPFKVVDGDGSDTTPRQVCVSTDCSGAHKEQCVVRISFDSFAHTIVFLLFHPVSLTGSIEVATCANQDPLEATTGLKPLFGIDVWEHAYYVDYRNVRPGYVSAIWDRINWDVVEERLAAAKSP